MSFFSDKMKNLGTVPTPPARPGWRPFSTQVLTTDIPIKSCSYPTLGQIVPKYLHYFYKGEDNIKNDGHSWARRSTPMHKSLSGDKFNG